MRPLVLSALLVGALTAPAVVLAMDSPAGESRLAAAFTLKGVEPPPVLVETGDDAPDVSWESPQGWRRLRDLRAQGTVLIVLGASESALAQLERERPALQRMGVVPAAVVERRSGACQSLGRRLDLGFTMLPDPQRVIGAQFNALDPRTRTLVPAWFVVDREGRVRGLGRGALPRESWTTIAADALHLPLPDVPLPASSH